MTSDERTQQVLNLARAAIHKGQAPLAIEYLKTIQSEIEDLASTSPWAEHELIYAGALAGMNDPAAETAFEETLERISHLSEPNRALEMRAHEDLGKYLAGKRSRSSARNHYQLAERIAVDLDRDEDVARIQLCIIRIDLEESRDPRIVSLQNLRHAAKDCYTAREQHAAWMHYDDEIQSIRNRLIAARKGSEATVDYFRGVLSEIRRNCE
ncbi:MAG: hypothetical protein WBR26_04360 [Candidatus Acidiferrum sp.]